jgi:hypothetical protein
MLNSTCAKIYILTLVHHVRKEQQEPGTIVARLQEASEGCIGNSNVRLTDLSVWTIWSWRIVKYTNCQLECWHGNGQNCHDRILSEILAKQQYRHPQHNLQGLS